MREATAVMARRAADVALVVGGVAVAAASYLAVTQDPPRPPSPAGSTTTVTSAISSASPSVAAAVGRLDDRDRPWVMAVVGDGNGDDPQEWVHLLAERLAAQKDRPVIVQSWSARTSSYVGARTVGDGEGAPITVWNGSAPGGPATSAEHFRAQVPERPDLLVLSHGHAITSSVTAGRSMGVLLEASVDRWGPGTVAHAVVLQNPRLDELGFRQESVVAAVRGWAREVDVQAVEVFRAFQGGDVSALLVAGGKLPSAAGHEVWAGVVARSLFP